MTAPSVPFATWILAAFDPILVVVAVYLGWKADQAGKIFVAVIAALGASLLADWLLTAIGMPLLAPVSGNGPMLLPVRSIAALVWAAAAYAISRRRRSR
jgi:membrane-bound metal-dependent hydrolase YbcI (DUF457 family)